MKIMNFDYFREIIETKVLVRVVVEDIPSPEMTLWVHTAIDHYWWDLKTSLRLFPKRPSDCGKFIYAGMPTSNMVEAHLDQFFRIWNDYPPLMQGKQIIVAHRSRTDCKEIDYNNIVLADIYKQFRCLLAQTIGRKREPSSLTGAFLRFNSFLNQVNKSINSTLNID